MSDESGEVERDPVPVTDGDGDGWRLAAGLGPVVLPGVGGDVLGPAVVDRQQVVDDATRRAVEAGMAAAVRAAQRLTPERVAGMFGVPADLVYGRRPAAGHRAHGPAVVDGGRVPVDGSGLGQVYGDCVVGCDFTVTGYHAKRGGRVRCGSSAAGPAVAQWWEGEGLASFADAVPDPAPPAPSVRLEWGWSARGGAPVAVGDEVEARGLASRMPGSSVHARLVGPWTGVDGG